jgi:hypothetical protein
MKQAQGDAATFTLRVYRKAMKRRDGEPDLLRALVGAEVTTLADLESARSISAP